MLGVGWWHDEVQHMVDGEGQVVACPGAAHVGGRVVTWRGAAHGGWRGSGSGMARCSTCWMERVR
jgi:hypothetical protein